MKPKFKRTVDSGDLEGTRISLSNEMMLDPRGESFKEMRTYAEKAFPNLYEKHNSGELDQDKNKWSESLLFATKNALDDNFSKERLDFYFNLAKVVLKDKAASLEKESCNTTTTTRGESSSKPYSDGSTDTRNHTREPKNNLKPLFMGLTIGGLLVGGTGLIMGRTILTSIGLIGAAIGGGLLYNEQRK